MTNVNDVFESKYLSAKDLKGTEPIVTIESVEVADLRDGSRKYDIAMVGKRKHFLANKTNSMRLAYMFGDESDGWPGNKFQLYTELVDFQGKPTDALRVRPAKGTAPAPAPAPKPAPRKPAAEFNDSIDEGEIPF